MRNPGRFRISVLLYLSVLTLFAASNLKAESGVWHLVPNPSNIAVQLYGVEGESFKEIHKNLMINGPASETGTRHYAAARWNVKWHWPFREGKPDYKNSTVDLSVTLVIPVPNSRAVRASSEWSEFNSRMVAHELTHADHGAKAARETSKLLMDIDGSMQPRRTNKLIEEILITARRMDLAYDRDTRHGASEGVALISR